LAIVDTNSFCYQRQRQDDGKDDTDEEVAKYMSDKSLLLSARFSLGGRLFLTTAIKDVK